MGSIKRRKSGRVFGFCQRLLVTGVGSRPRRCRERIVRCLFSTVFYRVLKRLGGRIGPSRVAISAGRDVGRSSCVLHGFVRVLSGSGNVRHSMKCCTSTLYCDPGRFSGIVGRTYKHAPLSLVGRGTVRRVGCQLGRSSGSVGRVTRRFGFPGRSFFKGCIGSCLNVSPTHCHGAGRR